MRRATIAIDLLLPRHRNAQGVLRVDQVIHTLGIFDNRERYAALLTVMVSEAAFQRPSRTMAPYMSLEPDH